MQRTKLSEPIDAEALESILAEIARQILDHGIGAVGNFGQWGCSSVCVDVCPEGVGEVITAGACRVGVNQPDPSRLGSMGSYIDHTLLKPDATAAEIDKLCDEAR